MTSWRTTFISLAVVISTSTALLAQTAPPDEALQSAMALLQKGDDAGAVTILEQLVSSPEVPSQAFALLGALYMEAGRPSEALQTLRGAAESAVPDAAVLFTAGRAARAVGELELAESYLERCLTLAPDSPAARELGLLLGGQRRYEEALVLLSRWVRTRPGDAEARMAAAVCAIELQRPPDAELMLSDLPQEDPRVRLLWGRLLLLQGDPWGALATLKAALDGAPAELELELRQLSADAHAEVGQSAEAVALLADYASHSAGVALQLALAQYQGADLEGSLATIQPWAAALSTDTAKEWEPQLVGGVALHYGRLLAKKGSHEQAVPFFEMATRAEPEEMQAWQALGQSLAGAGRRDEANAALERFQELSAAATAASKGSDELRDELADPTAKALARAVKLADASRFEDALRVVQRERELAPRDLRPQVFEGRLLLQLGRLDEALEVVQRILGGAPENADAAYIRGAVQMRREDLEAAEVDFRQALLTEPSHIAAMNDLAVLLIDNDPVEARQLLERVLELNPGNELAASNLAYLTSR